MYVYRFNPVYDQWVVLGGTPEASLSLAKAHFFEVEKERPFAAATHPKQQFIVDPPSESFGHHDQHLLYKEQPPIGEHELLVYRRETAPFQWEPDDWQAWAEVVQERLLQLHHNPHLHHVFFAFDTRSLGSIEGYQRVGDLIGTSHPVMGSEPILDQETASKLIGKEEVFVVRDAPYGHLYVPSAPLHEKELWYIPDPYRTGFEQAAREEVQGLAGVLADVLPALRGEFAKSEWIIRLHTTIIGKEEQATWWLQLYEAPSNEGILPTRPLPESFVQRLHYILAAPR